MWAADTPASRESIHKPNSGSLSLPLPLSAGPWLAGHQGENKTHGGSSCPSRPEVGQQWFSTRSDFVPEDIRQYLETFLVVTNGKGGYCYRCPVGQECWQTPYKAQDRCPRQSIIQPRVSRVRRLGISVLQRVHYTSLNRKRH